MPPIGISASDEACKSLASTKNKTVSLLIIAFVTLMAASPLRGERAFSNAEGLVERQSFSIPADVFDGSRWRSLERSDIALCIVSHKGDYLTELLRSLQNTDLLNYTHRVMVINNGPYTTKLNVKPPDFFINNMYRPKQLSPFLSRDWNACLQHGFGPEGIRSRQAVVLLQQDATPLRNFATTIRKWHFEKHKILITHNRQDLGDAIHSYTYAAVERIGMFDERFDYLAYQEIDFFTRAVLTAPDDVALCNGYNVFKDSNECHGSPPLLLEPNLESGIQRNDYGNQTKGGDPTVCHTELKQLLLYLWNATSRPQLNRELRSSSGRNKKLYMRLRHGTTRSRMFEPCEIHHADGQ